ncbi:MAG: Fic family protein [Saprospiraceae bacterium]|nr:Fic family protein [Bacteroidia bacterium]NNE14645.1 Fic family protein [Saprospiraceae bacterium]NNL91865.1 Fic family protein [Saprospiraceae bacterium]
MEKVHTSQLKIDWGLIKILSKIDRFDASWSSIEKREGQSLKQLKSIATVRSVGASTRIEGSKMTDDEVDVLLTELEIEKLEDRDSQEVAGYFEVLDTITKSYTEIQITENVIKGLHNSLLRFSEKDQWHKGDYKQHSNNVEATLPDGTTQIIFETTPPGYQTEDAMRSLIEWYQNDSSTHPLVKSALFTYEFLSIHPFQDGNGRLSRLLSTLLMLKHGYKWVQYVSFENEIENRKTEYYRELRKCQAMRPNENITTWINFFFDALQNIQNQLLKKLESKGTVAKLSPREKSILLFIETNPGCKSGQISKRLDIPNPTVKRILKELVKHKLIEKFGVGPGTNYSIF